MVKFFLYLPPASLMNAKNVRCPPPGSMNFLAPNYVIHWGVTGVYIFYFLLQKYELLVGWGTKMIFTEKNTLIKWVWSGKKGRKEEILLYLGEKYHFGKRGWGKNSNYLDNIHPWGDIQIKWPKRVRVEWGDHPSFFAKKKSKMWASSQSARLWK